jgi:hypothetical protein
MPRILPREMAKASRLHPLLGKLMGVCRTLPASKRELRWLEDEILRLDSHDSYHFLEKYNIRISIPQDREILPKILLQKFVEARAKGIPIQLVVGT